MDACRTWKCDKSLSDFCLLAYFSCHSLLWIKIFVSYRPFAAITFSIFLLPYTNWTVAGNDHLTSDTPVWFNTISKPHTVGCDYTNVQSSVAQGRRAYGPKRQAMRGLNLWIDDSAASLLVHAITRSLETTAQACHIFMSPGPPHRYPSPPSTEGRPVRVQMNWGVVLAKRNFGVGERSPFVTVLRHVLRTQDLAFSLRCLSWFSLYISAHLCSFLPVCPFMWYTSIHTRSDPSVCQWVQAGAEPKPGRNITIPNYSKLVLSTPNLYYICSDVET